MADALNDTSLNVEAIPYDIDFSTDDMNSDDIQAVITYFFGETVVCQISVRNNLSLEFTYL